MFNIWKDIRSGALPVHEIPGYLIYQAGRHFWQIFAIGMLLLCALFLATE